MNTILVPSLVAYVVVTLASALVTRRALGSLGDEDKARMARESPGVMAWWFLPAAILPAVWLAWVYRQPDHPMGAGPAILGAALALLALSYAGTVRQYARLGLPPAFLRTFALSRALRLAAIAIFYVGLYLFLRQAAGAR